jgi:ribosomal protein L24E
VFTFDYDGSGKLSHLALYRPGTGTMWILNNSGGAFAPLYAQGDPGSGIGGYDLKSPSDLAFSFDYNGSGKLDHMVLYRPGTGTMWVLANNGGTFIPVYHQGDPGNGIGGYDLKSPADRAFAFDYDSSGKLDHVVLYRPATGTIWILKNNGGNFAPVYHQGDPGNGIGGYDLKSPADLVFSFDYDSSGKSDHLVLYRPGTGTMWILKNTAGVFAAVYAQGDPGSGIGGYDLRSPSDRAFAFDYNGTGKLDHLVLYRPGTGTLWILQNAGGVFTPVYNQGDPGRGIGGYDLKSAADRILPFDYENSGKQNYLALYRPGTGTMWILKKQ